MFVFLLVRFTTRHVLTRLSLQITALAELHRWQQRFEKQSRADHEEVIAGIKNLEHATAEIEQLVKAQTQVIADANVKHDKQHAELVGYLAVVQHVFKSIDQKDSRYKEFRRSLYCIMDKPGRLFADQNLDHGEIEWISKVRAVSRAALGLLMLSCRFLWRATACETFMKVCIWAWSALPSR
jgi:predicted  nucleic acid-binding Zn-ribbon protein